jgi:peroxiredoxin family protein
MSNLQSLGVFLVLWGLATLAVGVFQPAAVWNNMKIQSFVKSFGDRGTQVFLGFWGLMGLGGGIALLVTQGG